MNELQKNYYGRTAHEYENAHVNVGDEHYIALEFIASILQLTRSESALDIGAGTGRGMRFLAHRVPQAEVVGIEPSSALRSQALELGTRGLTDGLGESIPFDDDSIDVVYATGVMHHVSNPGIVVDEMMRVARKAVCISDGNRFGQTSVTSGSIKLMMRTAKVWDIFMKARTKGKGYMVSEGDGVFYSYSIFDSVPQLTSWSPRTYIIPTTSSRPGGLTGPLVTSSHGLLVSIKEPCFEGWAGVNDDGLIQ